MTQAGTALYVYGVMPADARRSLAVEGVDGAVVQTVEHGGLAALTSPVEGDALAAAREVRAHWRVLQEATATTAVLPVRFGTLLESEAAVRERLLAPNADHLLGLLEQVAGRVQLSVKGDYREEDLLREIVAGSAPIAALAARVRELSPEAGYYDRIQLGEQIAGAVERRREADTRRAVELLGPASVASRVEGPSGPGGAFNLAFLVERDAEEKFGQCVAALAAEVESHIDIRFIGPLPPYSFVQAELGAEASQWD